MLLFSVMRIKVNQSLVNDTDIKIVPSKKKKVFRAVGVKAKELRERVVFLEGGAKCDCPPLDNVNGRQSESQLIVAGNRTRDRLVVSLIQAVDRQQGLRRALNDIRKKEDVCRTVESTVPRRSQAGSSGSKVGTGGKEPNKKKKKQDKKTTAVPPTKNNKAVRPPSTSKGGEKISEAHQNPSGSGGQGSQGKGKSREGRQHTATSPRPTKKPGHKKGQRL